MTSVAEKPTNRQNNRQKQNLLEVPPAMVIGFGNNRLLIDEGVYNAFVAWDRQAMLRYQLALDETARMTKLLADAAGALCLGGGCFVTRAVNALDPKNSHRHVLRLSQKHVAHAEKTGEFWVIEPLIC